MLSLFFFFNDTATTEIYTLSLHDALPISVPSNPKPLPTLPGTIETPPKKVPLFPPAESWAPASARHQLTRLEGVGAQLDRKSTRLNSSHGYISYAVFCLKKKKKHK